MIINEIQSVARKLNISKMRQIDFAQNSSISISAVRYHFGQWNNALIAAGLEPLTQEESLDKLRENNTLEDNILLIELLKLYYKYGKITHSLINSDSEYSVRPYVKRWGSPQKALDEALKRANEGLIDVGDNEIDLSEEEKSLDDKNGDKYSANTEELSVLKQNTNGLQRKNKPKEIFGQPIDFRGLRFAPINEQGVVYLFGMISNEIGFYIESVRTGFPDCEGKRCCDKKNNLWEHVKIEFEFKSSNFIQHGHNPDECDVIVCWQHDWKECPLEVIELKEEIRKLPKMINFT